jgi:hypothetical protein
MEEVGLSINGSLRRLATDDWSGKWVSAELEFVKRPNWLMREVVWRRSGKLADYALDRVDAAVARLVPDGILGPAERKLLITLQRKLSAEVFGGRFESSIRAIEVAINRAPEWPEWKPDVQLGDGGIARWQRFSEEASKAPEAFGNEFVTKVGVRLPYALERMLEWRDHQKFDLSEVQRKEMVKRVNEMLVAEPGGLRVLEIRLELAGVESQKEMGKLLRLGKYLNDFERTARHGLQALGLWHQSEVELLIEGLFSGASDKHLRELMEGNVKGVDEGLKGRALADLHWLAEAMQHLEDRAQFRQQRLDWVLRNGPYHRIKASQSDDPNLANGSGICYHSAFRVHLFRLKHPDATPEDLETWMRANGGIFSAKERFFQASYSHEGRIQGYGLLSQLAVEQSGVKENHLPLRKKGEVSPEMVVKALVRAANAGQLAQAANSTMLNWRVRGGGGHAIQVDLDKHRLGFWDANLGQFTYPDLKTFIREFTEYLRLFSSNQRYRINFPTLKES